MLVFLIHVRDPQFYALPAKTRARNGNIRVMGFPPIGIMSLSAVVKRAGHECVMFDQANPDTPNEVIIEEIKRKRPTLVGLSFLSTTSYPYAKILARQIRAADQLLLRCAGRVEAPATPREPKARQANTSTTARTTAPQPPNRDPKATRRDDVIRQALDRQSLDTAPHRRECR